MNKTIAKLLLLSTFIGCNQQQVKEGYYRGQDYLGKTRECAPMGQRICTEIFTQADKFALDCREAGNRAIQCGCHEWICITK